MRVCGNPVTNVCRKTTTSANDTANQTVFDVSSLIHASGTVTTANAGRYLN